MTDQATHETTEIEIFVAVNEDGAYEVGVDEVEAGERLDENQGGHQRHFIKLTLTVPLPKVIEVSGSLPVNASGEYSLTVNS